MTKIKNHCEKHEEYTVSSIMGEHCPDCQRALAELWADRWGWYLYKPYISEHSERDPMIPTWRVKDQWEIVISEMTAVYDHQLMKTVISPAGAFKAWEWAEEQGFLIHISSSDDTVAFLLAASEIEAKIK